MRIAFVSSDWTKESPPRPGGAGFVRLHVPGRALAEAGHEVVWGTGAALHKEGWLTAVLPSGELHTERPDVVVIQRWMHKDAAAAQEVARENGQIVVHDIDDWFDGLSISNQAFDSTHPKRNPDANRDHYRRALNHCDLVTASTPYLADRLRQRLRVPVKVIRNTIDMRKFPLQEVRTDSARSGMIVGWVGAMAWRSGDLESIRGVFPGVLEHCNASFVHHGANPEYDREPAWESLGVPTSRVVGWRPMVPAENYGVQLMAGFDVGVVPLSDIPFNHAKSAIKGMEYAAAGIPFVASDTAEYRRFAPHAVARRPRDWTKKLIRLLDDDALRSEQAEVNYERVRLEDVSKRWIDWEQTYEQALKAAISPVLV